jgi:hypothetical protein
MMLEQQTMDHPGKQNGDGEDVSMAIMLAASRIIDLARALPKNTFDQYPSVSELLRAAETTMSEVWGDEC